MNTAEMIKDELGYILIACDDLSEFNKHCSMLINAEYHTHGD